MKTINRLAVLAALGASLGTTAFAQFDGPGRDGGPPGGPGGGQFTNRPPMISAAQLAANYAALAAYDTDKDGKLSPTEQSAVAQALVDGKLQPPGPPRGYDGGTPPAPSTEMAQRLAPQMAATYAAIFPYDANKDGQLDATEQAAVTTALSNGTLKLPMGRGPGGGGRRGGPGGPGGPGRPGGFPQ